MRTRGLGQGGVGVLHVGGWNLAGDDVGPITIPRNDALFAKIGRNGIFIVPAGSLAPATQEPICLLVKNRLIRLGVPRGNILIPQSPIADNTIAEVEEAIKLIEEYELQGRQLYVSTSWWHMLRTLVIWRKYGKGLKPKPVYADFFPHPKLALWIPREAAGIIQLWRGKTGPRYIET